MLYNPNASISNESPNAIEELSRILETEYRVSVQSYLEFPKLLTSALDTYTCGHSERVFFYSSLIADNLDLLPEEKAEIQIAAYLHDIGKLWINNTPLLTKKRLTAREWETIKEHPEKGANLAKSLGVSKKIEASIRHHHERLDGAGYSHGLASESIPLGARVIAVADAYDAMTSDRAYRDNTMATIEAQDELTRCAGSQFDPQMVNIFTKALNNNSRISTLTWVILQSIYSAPE